MTAHKQEPGSRVVGEREERLREENAQLRDELRALRPVLDEVKPRPAELIARVDAALASSPSPPDREQAVEKVTEAIVAAHAEEIRAFLAGEVPANEWRPENYARAVVAALFGPGDDRCTRCGKELRLGGGLGDES